MNTSDELSKLADLHARGVLSDEEFAKAKARVLNGESPQATPGTASNAQAAATVNSLRRSRSDRWIGGVCGGIGRVTGLDGWVWRLIFTLGMLCAGSGLLLYILLWIFVPEE
jgi:phage shock protein PspC (stress-responsive transcriptional regulator)